MAYLQLEMLLSQKLHVRSVWFLTDSFYTTRLAFVPSLVVIPWRDDRFIPYTDFNIEMAYLQLEMLLSQKLHVRSVWFLTDSFYTTRLAFVPSLVVIPWRDDRFIPYTDFNIEMAYLQLEMLLSQKLHVRSVWFLTDSFYTTRLAFVPSLVVIPWRDDRFIPYTDFNIEMAYLQLEMLLSQKLHVRSVWFLTDSFYSTRLAFIPSLVVMPSRVDRFIPYTDFNIEMAYLQLGMLISQKLHGRSVWFLTDSFYTTRLAFVPSLVVIPWRDDRFIPYTDFNIESEWPISNSKCF